MSARGRSCMKTRTSLAILTLSLLAVKTNSLAETVRVTAESYPAGGRRIQLDHFQPASIPSTKGAVIVLYGAGGMIFDGPEMRRVARALALDGYDVSLIHYFNRTGTLVTRDREMQQNFEVWLETVRKGIEHVRLTHANGRPIDIYGYSLGAFLAVAAASNNPGVAAVAEHAGGIWNNQKKRIGSMPPVFMIHGQVDQRVPLDQYARPLQVELRKKQGSVKTHFYAHEGHKFSASSLAEVRHEVPLYFDRQRHVNRSTAD